MLKINNFQVSLYRTWAFQKSHCKVESSIVKGIISNSITHFISVVEFPIIQPFSSRLLKLMTEFLI